MNDQNVLDAFHRMWGPFPEPVLLVHKNRTVLAANQLAQSCGYTIESKCFSYNPEAVTKVCKDCQANLALREHRAVYCEEVQGDDTIRAYWMPLTETPDVYVHFGIGVARAMGKDTANVRSSNPAKPGHDATTIAVTAIAPLAH